MSDVRCPMCGKANPPDKDVCKYCQARLKPLVINSEQSDARQGLDTPAPEEVDAYPDLEVGSNSDLPGWLKSLRSQDEEFAQAASEPDELPDWIGSPTTHEEAHSPEDEVPGWLSSLRGESSKGEGQTIQTGGDATEQPSQDVPDWLAGMRDVSGEEFDEPEAGEDAAAQFGEEEPEWLRRIDSQDKPEVTRQSLTSSPFEDAIPAEARQEGELLDDAAIPGIIFAEHSSGIEAEQLPDWLNKLDETAPQDKVEPAPDWLAGQSPTGTPSGGQGAAGTLYEVEEVPQSVEKPGDRDVLKPVITLAAAGQIDALSQEHPEPTQEEIAPDWLDDIVSSKQGDTVTADGAAIKAEEVPDWLSGYDESTLINEGLSSSSGGTTPDLSLDWLEEERQTLDTTPEQVLLGSEFLEGSVSPFEGVGESQSFLSGELPEWLGETTDKAAPVGAVLAPGEEGGDLARADLPGWLESMRPIETAALVAPLVEASDKQVEGTGPLAGLRSVLPSEFELGARRTPAAYTVKLQVSDSQKTHASIIDELIKSEGEAPEVSGHRALGPQQLLLIGIFVILLVVLLWPVITGSQSVAMPTFSTEAYEASSVIGNLPAAAPVLLAVDYEPGLSGEMEATANAVLDHLMLKGAYLTMVSTASTGPAQAERLVQGASTRGDHAYQGIDMYANLGYIPGGTVGIRSFAESPRRIMPFALDGSSVWDSGALANIQSLSDFAMVMVITENPYTARSWIEQVKPIIGEKPLVMVVSAQAEPVVRPYFEGAPRVVQGIVAGLPGGASYENMIGRFSLARKYWDAYSIGISLIAAVLLVGGVVNLILYLTSSRKRAAGGAKP